MRKRALAEVRKWLKSQSHIRRVRLDSSFILRFLRMQKFEMKETCEILDKYLTMRHQHPAWFQNLDCRVCLSTWLCVHAHFAADAFTELCDLKLLVNTFWRQCTGT